jgi:DNA helicase II / ATP-dependent DNA helicase PcrA
MAMTRELTDQQKEIVFGKSGLFVVRACPGSGKTFTVASRLARFLSEWRHAHQGIAAISFTNIAWEEISGYLQEEFGVKTPLSHPHFLGTIDSFINKYIFLPLGHVVMGTDSRPELKGPPHDNSEPIGNWLWWGNEYPECNQSLCKLNDFSYDEHGNLMNQSPRSHFKNCRSSHIRCNKLKEKFNQLGYATQSDANYFALKVLKDYPCVVKALATRFPVFMVDEAQDTSSIQMKIFDILIENGVREMMLVGDPDQAIYEWRNAEPILFNKKFDLWKENSVELKENWRSTQSICDFACRISSSNAPMMAKNKELADFEIVPDFWSYSRDEDLPDLLSRFIDECKKHAIEESGINVLTRGKEFLNSIVPGSVQKGGLIPWKDDFSKEVARSTFLLNRGKFRDAFRILEREMCKLMAKKPLCRAKDLDAVVEKVGFVKWRGKLFQFLNSLPITNCILSQWILEANFKIGTNNFVSELVPELSIKHNSGPHRHSELTFSELFATPDVIQEGLNCSIGTVHSAKGKTLDAVLLVLKKRAGRDKDYTNLFNCDILQNEELRVLYVAITRARKILVLAVPDDCITSWKCKFEK